MIPKYIQPFLWSYDIKSIDINKNKDRIIINILNLGTQKAIDWLFKTYPKRYIKEVFKKSPAGEWSKKSLNFWSLMLNVKPDHKKRTKKFYI